MAGEFPAVAYALAGSRKARSAHAGNPEAYVVNFLPAEGRQEID